MKLRMLVTKPIFDNLYLVPGQKYVVEDIIQDTYKIKIPMKQKGKFRYALVKDSEGELID